MIAFLSLIAHLLVSPFKTRARLEVEIILLRHQLNVLRRKLPSKPRLSVADRLIFVWLYRLFPSALDAIVIVQAPVICHVGIDTLTCQCRHDASTAG